MQAVSRALFWGALAVLLCSWATPVAAAIFEDQAGTYDWYKQYVGRPESVAFVPGKERVFLSTSQNLVASLQTKSGNVAWRRKYTEQDTLDAVLVLRSPPVVLTTSKGGKVLRAWDSLEGAFRWEAQVFEGVPAVSSAGSTALAAWDGGDSKNSAVAVAASNTVKLLGGSKGDVLWSSSVSEAAAAASRKLLVTDDGVITLVAFTPGSPEVFVAGFAAADGSPAVSERQLEAAAALSSSAAVSGSSVALLSEDGQQLCTLTLPGVESLSCKELASISPQLDSGSSQAVRLAAAAPGTFSLSGPAGVSVVSVSADGSAEQLHWFPDAAVASSAAANLMALAASSTDGSSINIQLTDAASGQVLDQADVAVPPEPYPVSGPAPHVVAAWLDTKRQGAGSSSSIRDCKLLLLWSDHKLTFVQHGQVAWSREEALASGSSTLILDLPAARAEKTGPSDTGDDSSSTGGTGSSGSSRVGILSLFSDKEGFKKWVRLQVLSVLIQFKLNTDPEKEEFYALRQQLSDNNLPWRDTNGFRKLIVLLTAPGKVFALHSGDGRIMWASSSAAAATSSAEASSSSILPQHHYLMLWRRFHDLTHAPQVAVLSAGQQGQQSAVHVLNGHSGQQLQHLELPYGVAKVVPLHPAVHDGAAEQFSFLLIEPTAADDDAAAAVPAPSPRVHLLPDTPATQERLASISSNTFFWLLQQQQTGAAAGQLVASNVQQQQQTVLRGFSFERDAKPDASSGLLPVVPAWQVALPGSLLALTARDPSEPVYSYVKILGDRSLKYKYVNPNLLFVATTSRKSADAHTSSPAAASDQKQQLSPEDHVVTVTLLNTVTGAVLHQQEHAGASGPVHAVVSEHWVVYTLWDRVALRQQVAVIELYDASPRDLSIESILLGRTQHADRLSSYSSMQLEVLSQSFYLQHAIKGLSVSQTRQGITTKQLLINTINDQLYALDKRYLDPRRPMAAKATPEEAEEGLLPYSDLIIFNTLQYATQDKQVLQMRGVTSAPAVLESTSLLFCYGTDMFFTRITPAAHFDSLQSDFSYGLLVVALIALVAGTWFASYSSQQAMLKAKWQ